MQLCRELLPLRHKLQNVRPYAIQLRAHGGDAADLGVTLGLDLDDSGGEAAELLLSGDEVLLERHMDAGEALVVGEQGLDLTMTSLDALLEGADRDDRGGGGGGGGGMCKTRLVEAREPGGVGSSRNRFRSLLRLSLCPLKM